MCLQPPSSVDLARDRRRRCGRKDKLEGKVVDGRLVAAGGAAEDLEGFVRRKPEALGEHPLRLLDHDPRIERPLELLGALA
jgi:hypothetical protein